MAKFKMIHGRVSPDFHSQCLRHAKTERISLSTLVKRALLAYMDKPQKAYRDQIKKLETSCGIVSKQNEKLEAQLQDAENKMQTTVDCLEVVTSERDDFQNQIEHIAESLSTSTENCILRINEQKYQIEQLQSDVNAVNQAKTAVEASRDAFKMKYTETQAKLDSTNRKLNAYEKQGFWARVFKRKPY